MSRGSTRRPARSRGGRHGHEPRATIATREHRVLELSVLGWRQHDIAGEVGVSQAAVSRILRRVEERHLRELGDLVGRQKARQAFRLEHIYAQAMRAWEQSKADTTKRRQRQTQTSAGSAGLQVAELTSENRDGDPRYLGEARGALRDLRTLFGLDAPDRVVVAATRSEHMTDAALEQELAKQQRLVESPTPEPLPISSVTPGGSDVPRS